MLHAKKLTDKDLKKTVINFGLIFLTFYTLDFLIAFRILLANIVYYLYSESLPSILTDETIPDARLTDWYQELEKLHNELAQKLESLKISVNEAESKINSEAAVIGVQ